MCLHTKYEHRNKVRLGARGKCLVFTLQLNSFMLQKRLCKEARYSPSKYAVQMEIREIGQESESQTEMETEPSLTNAFPVVRHLTH